jgi:hypothetical protein
MSTYHGYISTQDDAAGSVILDYSPVMFAAPLPGSDIKLWPLVSKVSDLTDTTLYWMEDDLSPITVTALSSGAGALTADVSDVDLDVASGAAASKFITAGCVLRDTTAGKHELVLVTGVSTDTLTIVRAYGLSSSNGNTETHAVSAVWEVVQRLNYEGSSFGTPSGAFPTRRTNYTAIMDEQISMTGTDLARRFHSIDDYWAYQVNHAWTRLQRQLERSLIWGKEKIRHTDQYDWGSFAGIGDILIDLASTTNYTASFGSFSYEAFDDAVKAIYNGGYGESGSHICLMPPAGIQVAAYIHDNALRGDYSNTTTKGLKTTAISSTLGPTIPIVPCASLASDEIMILDLSRIKIHFMTGRELLAFEVPLGTAGADIRKRRLLTELSVELHNANAHYFGRGVTYTRP